ncbi:MAG: GNAT family N-acetyltransferase [bacterium]
MRKNKKNNFNNNTVDSKLDVTLRRLHTQEDYEACIVLQKMTWGEHFMECVPPAILMVSQKVGGVTAGAFDTRGKLLGFVFGLTGVKEGRLVHWSHMLAVRKDFRGHGIGTRLKLYQRELLLDLGIEVIYWTYDPLVARNAHLNLNRLGAKIQEYVPEMYGDDTGSDLHRGIGMDRFIVAWYIADEQVSKIISGKLSVESAVFELTPVVNTQLREDGLPIPMEGELPLQPTLRIEIPSEIEVIQDESLELAAQWRANTRKAFLFYMERGYQVTSFYRDPESGRCFYVLNKSA